MNRQFLLILLSGVIVLGLAMFALVKQNQSSVVQLNGEVKDVLVLALGDGSSLAMIDFEAKNPSSIGFEVNGVEIEAHVGKDTLPSTLFGKRDLGDVLEFQKYTPRYAQIGFGDQVKAGETAKRMVAARFEVMPEQLADAEFVIRFTNVNHVMSEVKGKKAKRGSKR